MDLALEPLTLDAVQAAAVTVQREVNDQTDRTRQLAHLQEALADARRLGDGDTDTYVHALVLLAARAALIAQVSESHRPE